MSDISDADPTAGSPQEGTDGVDYVSLSTESRRRYLNYALSVIQARALPDVRDGLKPVQRRILYVMYEGLGLTATAKFRKCSKICGDTTGNFHPHGDSSVYDALCRMAQDFTFRYPLVDGWGNFGSIMGLPPAAMRYPEARLQALAEELMSELRYDTVDTRPNYDGTSTEPTVLPSRFPHLLVNGTQGIAVGMATNIPPHNLGEVIKACLQLIENWETTSAQLAKTIKGPDFPLGGCIVTDRATLKQIYEEGRGSIKVRAEWKRDVEKRKEVQDRLVVHSIPYGVETGPLLTEISAIVAGRKLPQLLDVSDQSDGKHGIRIVLEIKPGTDPEIVMAYLYKHTSLEQNFAYNATCLVPDEKGVLIPARLNLADMLRHYLEFRLKTVRRRLEYVLRQLERRIHILEGFAIVFQGLDKALRLIRQSQGKADAAAKLMANFPLDAEQTDAVLELALYRISSLEIDKINAELKEKQAEANRIRALLSSEKKLWGVVQKELEEVGEKFGDKRRTSNDSKEIAEYDPQAYIVRENTNVVLTRDGWIKRVGRLASVEGTRVREGDEVLDVLPGSTLDHIAFFANDGTAYTMRIDQVPVSSGYGEPVSKHFRMNDGVSLIAALSTDVRFTPADQPADENGAIPPFLLVVTAQGQVLRIPFSPYRVESTRTGRKYCKLADGDKVVHVELIRGATSVFLASREARVIHFALDEIAILTGVGKGVRGMNLQGSDQLLGAALMYRPSDCLRVQTTADKEMTFGQQKYSLTSRGGKGDRTIQRTGFSKILREPIQLVDWAKLEGG